MYIAILRGINVSGKNIIKMQDLRLLCETIGLNQVKTYIQSGNVVFTSLETDVQTIQTKITTAISLRFGFTVPCIVFTADYLRAVLANNPFCHDDGYDTAFVHLTFLSNDAQVVDYRYFDSKTADNEAYRMGNKVVYLYCPSGYGNTKLSNNVWEQKLGIEATTRNWKTCCELVSMTSV